MPTHHYVCLNRLHRWQRYQIVEQLLDRQLDKFGKISYIEKPPTLVKYSHRLPLVLDSVKIDGSAMHTIDRNFIQGALFNIVTESAYELTDGHFTPGMTEKTFKAIALGQIPIFVAPFNTVACYRNLGFDMFDDIIDHSYDQEPDPRLRIIKIIDQVERICQLSLDELVDLKKQLKSRFINNLENLKSYDSYDHEFPQWRRIFSKFI